MNCLFFRWRLAAVFACSTCLSTQAAEYCVSPSNKDGAESRSVVCCKTPPGWQGWKDDPHYWDGIDRFTKALLQALYSSSVSFRKPHCKVRTQCIFLDLKTRGRDPGGKSDVEAGLRDFVDELEQPQDLSPRNHPCVVVSRFDAFHDEDFGVLAIWQIRCPAGSQHLVVPLAQRDVLVIIDLHGPDMKDIVPKVDSLEQLARSVRISVGSWLSPDIISIDVRLPDQAIRDRLLQLTPVGNSADEVCRFLESPRLLRITQAPEWGGELHWVDNDLWTEIGHYEDPIKTVPVPKPTITTDEALRAQPQRLPIHAPTKIVKAVWKFDKQRKLRDIEIRREVVEFEPKQ